MANKDTVSMLDILNTELLALVEYARMYPTKIDTDPNSNYYFADTVQRLAEIEVNAKLGDVDSTDANKKQKYDDAVAKLKDNTRAASLIYGATKNQKALNSLYKVAGSLSSLIIGDKSMKTDTSAMYSGTNEITDTGVNFFVPKAEVDRRLRRKMRFADALNDVINGKTGYLCNYPMNQDNPDRCTYIGGAKQGLIELLGDGTTRGVLPACGIEGELVQNHHASSMLKYEIKLDAENTEKFKEQLLAPYNSLGPTNVRSHLVFTRRGGGDTKTLTDLSASDTEKPEEGREHGNSVEGQMEDAFNRMRDEMISGSDHPEDKFDASLKLKRGMIAKLIPLLKSTSGKMLAEFKVPDGVKFPDKSVDPSIRDRDRPKCVDAVSKFYCRLAQLAKVPVSEKTYHNADTVFTIVEPDKYMTDAYDIIAVLGEKLPLVANNEYNFRILENAVLGIRAFLNVAEANLKVIYGSMANVGENADVTVMANEKKAVSDARTRLADYMENPVISIGSRFVTRDDIMKDMGGGSDSGIDMPDNVRKACSVVSDLEYKINTSRSASSLPSEEEWDNAKEAFNTVLAYYKNWITVQLWLRNLLNTRIEVNGKPAVIGDLHDMMSSRDNSLPYDLMKVANMVDEVTEMCSSAKTLPDEETRAMVSNQISTLLGINSFGGVQPKMVKPEKQMPATAPVKENVGATQVNVPEPAADTENKDDDSIFDELDFGEMD